MGRWSQRSRTGGGINQPLFMVQALHLGINAIIVTYNREVDAAQFVEIGFVTVPGTYIPDSIDQDSDNVIVLNYSFDVGSETALTWEGASANVLTPQTISIGA